MQSRLDQGLASFDFATQASCTLSARNVISADWGSQRLLLDDRTALAPVTRERAPTRGLSRFHAFARPRP